MYLVFLRNKYNIHNNKKFSFSIITFMYFKDKRTTHKKKEEKKT